MSAQIETNREVVAGLVAIVLALAFVLIAFLLHNVVWVVPGMLFGIGYMIWVFHRHGMPSANSPKAKV
ncbi:hypothetical protein [Thermococcus gammatolerans]|uniref:Uncharacterized protein n=1 Tax=Thermococcus gammatolerans (strain DSM 15229 / JCM 11827 / EJ3) TaxID=593117 RepID=C5A674_THEGJ|nr:hypothetical protein [Thermococcus gammatolerans]ACS33736.1 Hypothetical protein TGAM_1234 [Thermococcus gammatolerans EJ3]